MQLTATEYKNYLTSEIIKIFNPLIKQPLNLYIIDRGLRIYTGTEITASSFGCKTVAELSNICFANYTDEIFLKALFKQSYDRYGYEWLKFHCEKLAYLQRMVFEKCKIIQFIDMLPYNNQYLSRMTTYTPIMHTSGEVVAIQCSSIETFILRFQGHIESPNINTYDKQFYAKFSTREKEILFLICNGASHEHIAKMLNIARGTVAAIIHNQLNPKFSMDRSNAKELMTKAIRAGMHRTMPESLWHPCIIVLNRDLLDDLYLRAAIEY